MLHKPKISTLKHLHSIPRYFMHSIPIGSSIALLILNLLIINPIVQPESYALEEKDIGTEVGKEIEDNSINSNNTITNNSSTQSNVRDTVMSEDEDNNINNSNDLATVEREDSTVSKANNETMPLAAGDTTASLEILTGNLTEITPASTGNVSYRSHNISYSVQNPMDYTLRVSYANGNRALQYYGPNGTAVSAAGTAISGVGDGIEASSIPDNSWGFAWSDNTETSNEAMTYYTMPTNNNGTGLSNGVLTSGTESVDSTGKLTFAAKFASDAIAGHYKTQVLLSLAAMPHTVVFQVTYDCKGGTGCPSNVNSESTASSYQYTIPGTVPTRDGFTFLGYSTSSTATVADNNYPLGKKINLTASNNSIKLYAVWKGVLTAFPSNLSTMQDMTTDICDSVVPGTAGYLYDSRDGSVYSIQKFNDNRCWMTQNLKLDISTANSLTPDNSDVRFNWPATSLPSSVGNFLNTNDGNTKPYWNNGENLYMYEESYGYYYNWCAATAGTCNSISGDGNVASASICPKGWSLPTIIEYETILLAGGINFRNCRESDTCIGSSSSEDSNKLLNKPYNFSLTGLISDSSLANIGLSGCYWSSTSQNTDRAFTLGVYKSEINNGSHNRFYGQPIRCIAK